MAGDDSRQRRSGQRRRLRAGRQPARSTPRSSRRDAIRRFLCQPADTPVGYADALDGAAAGHRRRSRHEPFRFRGARLLELGSGSAGRRSARWHSRSAAESRAPNALLARGADAGGRRARERAIATALAERADIAHARAAPELDRSSSSAIAPMRAGARTRNAAASPCSGRGAADGAHRHVQGAWSGCANARWRAAATTLERQQNMKELDELATLQYREAAWQTEEQTVTIDPTSANQRRRRRPAPADRTATRANSLGKDAFLQLLVTQLQNQDPTSPQDDTRVHRAARAVQLARAADAASTKRVTLDGRQFFERRRHSRQRRRTPTSANEGKASMAVGSFSAGLSGLNANAADLSVIGNNLANINTVGFKASTRDLRGPRQPDRRRLEREPDADRPRRRHRADLAGLHPGRDREQPRRDQRRDPGQRLLRGERTGRARPTRAPATSASTATARW